MKVLGVIPARYTSVRFPGKSLADISGKSMIQRVYERAQSSSSLDRLVIATDDQRIFDHAASFGAEVIMTSADCKNGTERTADALHHIQNGFEVVINIQGDEPLLHPGQLDHLIQLISDPDTDCEISTLAYSLDTEEQDNPNIVKVVFEGEDSNGGAALGFSRDYEFIANASAQVFKHIGLYAFKRACLEKIVRLQPTPNEQLERLEQLRWLDHGYRIAVGVTPFANLSVDVPDDIEKILQVLKVNPQN